MLSIRLVATVRIAAWWTFAEWQTVADVPLPEELLGRSLWESLPETRETLIEAELRRTVEHAQTAEFRSANSAD